jgi:hypothetical protein
MSSQSSEEGVEGSVYAEDESAHPSQKTGASASSQSKAASQDPFAGTF